jgi:putative ABC transport system ATP-binding protein
MGSSGSGKTTLLNIIGLLDKPDSGKVEINQKSSFTKKEKLLLRRNTFAYVFQNYALIDNETVKQNLLISQPYNKSYSTLLMEETLEKVGLSTSVLDHKIYQLSGGEQQRIAMARIMLKPCEIILADEPTGNLDENNKQKIIEMFLELKRMGKTIVCVTHDKELGASSDRILELS